MLMLFGLLVLFMIMFKEHKGINANLVEAFKWYKKCADLNDEQCLFNVGNMYHEGHGVKQDYVEAIKWYLKAADKGYIDAYYNLGLMHEKEDLV